MDTLFVIGTELLPPALSFFVQSYMQHVVFQLALAIILLIIAVSIAQDREVRTYNGKDIYRRPKRPAPYSYDLRQKVINAIEL
ncbi:MAG: hypothetical protein P5694_25835, partial [Limnospira sp. PMC 1286.21]|nr:hypothetical protein [Limnospira sp. PMC 1249.20]MDT9323983.1 hypothetical protein [Limnospira sp. PMC 1290.21]MDT9329061.1 hypothetical protein [Limnospira sp. PMC 1286.21]